MHRPRLLLAEIVRRCRPDKLDLQERQRRQDLNARYRENGSIYAVRADDLTETECRLGGQVGIHEMPKSLSYEIDTPEDLRLVATPPETVHRDLTLVDEWPSEADATAGGRA